MSSHLGRHLASTRGLTVLRTSEGHPIVVWAMIPLLLLGCCPSPQISEITEIASLAGTDMSCGSALVGPAWLSLTSTGASDINDAGEVAATMPGPSGRSLAFLWLPEAAHGLPAGLHDLGTLGGESSLPMRITKAGQVVGLSETPEGTQCPFIWLPEPAYGLSAGMHKWSELVALQDAPTLLSEAYLCSLVASQAAGVENPGGVYDAFHTFLLDQVKSVPDRTGWSLRRFWDANARGQVVGCGTYQGEYRLFVLQLYGWPRWVVTLENMLRPEQATQQIRLINALGNCTSPPAEVVNTRTSPY